MNITVKLLDANKVEEAVDLVRSLALNGLPQYRVTHQAVPNLLLTSK